MEYCPGSRGRCCTFAFVVVTAVFFLMQYVPLPEWSMKVMLHFGAIGNMTDTSNETLTKLMPSTSGEALQTFPLSSEQCKNATFVTVGKGGRLGNMIAEYVTGFSYGRKYGKIPVLNENHRNALLPLFPHLSLRTEKETGCSPRNWSRAVASFPNGAIPPPWDNSTFVQGKDVCITGYSCDGKLFHEYRKEWILDFRFGSKLLRDVHSYFTTLFAKYKGNTTFIGIHVRRTDQVFHNQKLFGAKPVTAAYYQRAMAHFRKIFSNSVFIVATDDMKWSKQNIRNVNESMAIEFVEAKGRDFDFAVLSHCNHSIVSVGSFGFFAAYFGGGLVVAPKVVSKTPDFSSTGLRPEETLRIGKADEHNLICRLLAFPTILLFLHRLESTMHFSREADRANRSLAVALTDGLKP
ncbi:unnamed protein product [Darwinula stevensoni]|uniref:L-Fucosyltransferase n=1 Tax=Darwinula stevensoni TaxID=69355 RepID=A0A7R9FQG0_9CRUS|nr:unnamed protein product [Darwinula stevensoni]CAG0899719.1 unnamed protein product [Darwinula stevensoni]